MKKFLSCVLVCFLAVLCMVDTCIAESDVDLGSFNKRQLEDIKKDAEQAIADFHTVSSKTQSAIEKNIKKAVENIFNEKGTKVSWPWIDYEYTKDWDFYTCRTRIEYKADSHKLKEDVYVELFGDVDDTKSICYLEIGEKVEIDKRSEIKGDHWIRKPNPLLNDETKVDLSVYQASELSDLINEIDEEIKINHTPVDIVKELFEPMTKYVVRNHLSDYELSWSKSDFEYSREWDLYTLKTTCNYKKEKKITSDIYAEAFPLNGQYNIIYLTIDDEIIIDTKSTVPENYISDFDDEIHTKNTDQDDTNDLCGNNEDLVIAGEGNSNNIVRNIQEKMNELTDNKMTLSGMYDDSTVQRVKEFQKNNGYDEKNYLTLEEYDLLLSLCYESQNVSTEAPAAEILVAASEETTREAKRTLPETLKVFAPISGYDCEGMDLSDVVKAYEEAGFTNIILDPFEIEYAEGIGKDNQIVTFDVDGIFNFNKGDEFAPDVPVRIGYRKWISFPVETNNTVTEEKVQKEIYAQRGDINEDVREMQKALINLGYLEGSADGDFGSNTEKAVKKFQQANGFEADGILTESQAEKLWKSSIAISATRSNSGTTQNSTTKSSFGSGVNTQSNSENEKIVYITPTGKKYHNSASCAGKNAISTTLDKAKRSYGPCKKCVG